MSEPSAARHTSKRYSSSSMYSEAFWSFLQTRRYCYTMSQSSRNRSVLQLENISCTYSREEKFNGVRSANLGGHARMEAIPAHSFGKRLFKTWWITFPNCECAPSCLNHSKAIMALCSVLTSQVPRTFRGCFWKKKKKSPMMGSFVMPRNTVTVDVSLWCSIISWGGWLPKTLQLCPFTIPFKWNVASWEREREKTV
jgi:hypothetical protein